MKKTPRVIHLPSETWKEIDRLAGKLDREPNDMARVIINAGLPRFQAPRKPGRPRISKKG